MGSLLLLALASCRHGQTQPHADSAPDTLCPTDTTLLFFYSQGCEDCHEAWPVVRQWLASHPSVARLLIDVDSAGWNDGLLRAYAVERVPTVVLLAPGGKILNSKELEDALHGLEDTPDDASAE